MTYGRAPYGARGLKCPRPGSCEADHRRAPYGARGLKYGRPRDCIAAGRVAPRMGRVD